MTTDDDLDRCPYRGGTCPDHAHEWRPGVCPDPPEAITNADLAPKETPDE